MSLKTEKYISTGSPGEARVCIHASVTYVGSWRGRDFVFGRRGRRENRARRRVDGRGNAVLGRFVGRIPGREAQRLRPQSQTSAHVWFVSKRQQENINNIRRRKKNAVLFFFFLRLRRLTRIAIIAYRAMRTDRRPTSMPTAVVLNDEWPRVCLDRCGLRGLRGGAAGRDVRVNATAVAVPPPRRTCTDVQPHDAMCRQDDVVRLSL